LRDRASTNDIEKILRQLWNFDERFFGELIGNNDDYVWSVYSLVYLGQNEGVIKNLVSIYPLLVNSRFIRNRLGSDFQMKVRATFMDDVGHYLWEVQGLIEPEDHALFDWHGNRNALPIEQIEYHVRQAGLAPLTNPDFSPRKVLLHFTNLQDPFGSDDEYVHELRAFYRERGYVL
jgi:hypothetical protein